MTFLFVLDSIKEDNEYVKRVIMFSNDHFLCVWTWRSDMGFWTSSHHLHDRLKSVYFYFADNMISGTFATRSMCSSSLRFGVATLISSQQYGATAHWFVDVRILSKRIFRGRWTCLDIPIAWPSRSPVITPLEFFERGEYIKDCFYETLFPDMVTLRK